MQMRDVMRPARWVAGPDTLLRTAEHLMARHRVPYLPVVDGGRFVGLLTERDVLGYRARHGGRRTDWWAAPVEAAMQIAPRTARPDEDLDADRITEVMPIVENGYLVGMVTAADVLDAEIRDSLPPVRRLDATAADAMTEHPWTCRPTDSLVDAAKLMVDFEVRHLPVVEDGRLVGMLSDRDIRTIVGAPAPFVERGDSSLTVADAMTRDPLTVSTERRLRDIATELIEDNVGALPVLDPGGKLVGIISYVDALRALAA